ncbi:hypothetical protein [Microbacterium sp. CIAB417]|uniref:hypothetical protein n=1 Tax=Microbacterium sp. CIAB417 TaxID=2860287 RepID=UPI001FAC4FD4|nr:hypothetical protein [Microbacterium sp. CIAB417]
MPYTRISPARLVAAVAAVAVVALLTLAPWALVHPLRGGERRRGRTPRLRCAPASGSSLRVSLVHVWRASPVHK